MRHLARGFYAVFGTLAIGLGALALIAPRLALPPDESSALSTHRIREQGAHGVFLGLIAFWCMFHFEQRRLVHLALVVFALLFAVTLPRRDRSGRRPPAIPSPA